MFLELKLVDGSKTAVELDESFLLSSSKSNPTIENYERALLIRLDKSSLIKLSDAWYNFDNVLSFYFSE